MYKVLDDGEDAVVEGYGSWSKCEFDTFDEAVKYAEAYFGPVNWKYIPNNWTGEKVDYSRCGNTIEIICTEPVSHTKTVQQILILKTNSTSWTDSVVYSKTPYGSVFSSKDCGKPIYESPLAALEDGWKLMGPPSEGASLISWWFTKD